MLKYQQNWGNDSRQEREEREDPQVTYQQGSMAYEKMYLTPLNSASRHTPALHRLAEGRRDHLCLFMQNKPNLLKRQMNVSQAYRKDYENKWLRKHRKNKANTNPIQSQSNPIQSQYKANSNPIRSEAEIPHQIGFLYRTFGAGQAE